MNLKSIIYCIAIGSIVTVFGQKHPDDAFTQKKMRADLQLFRSIREAANSGVYKYRSQAQMDSLYKSTFRQIEESSSLLDFYNILWTITDFEGSLHNGLTLPPKAASSIKKELEGYFPLPVKIINGQLLINGFHSELPVGSQITKVNGQEVEKILTKIGKYYTTDGYNQTGKEIGINANFSVYYRLTYGKKSEFQLTYKRPGSNVISTISIQGTSYKAYKEAFKHRHSKNCDSLSYEGEEETPYQFKRINEQTAILSISRFSIGWNAEHPKHRAYLRFLDSIFLEMKHSGTENLIVDVRHNGGGSDPNDLVTYSYLTDREFMENKEAWATFRTPPYWKYNKEVSLIGKYLEKKAYVEMMHEDFPQERGDRFYQDETSPDHLVRSPSPHAFKGTIYLLVSPRTASAGSLFAAMVAGNDNTIVVGRETQGGYYGHNGHIPIRYRLPYSKIKFMFSVVNLEQDVPKKPNQIFGRGIIPDHEVEQTLDDFLTNRDPVLNFTLELINSRGVMAESGIPR